MWFAFILTPVLVLSAFAYANKLDLFCCFHERPEGSFSATFTLYGWPAIQWNRQHSHAEEGKHMASQHPGTVDAADTVHKAYSAFRGKTTWDYTILYALGKGLEIKSTRATA